MKAGDPPILVMAFPIAWMLAESTAGVGLEGSCVSKTGSVPFVTVTHWEEEPRLRIIVQRECLRVLGSESERVILFQEVAVAVANIEL